MDIHIHTHLYKSHTDIHINEHTVIFTHIHIQTHTWTHIYKNIYTSQTDTHINVHTGTNIHIHIHICMDTEIQK